MHKKYACKYRKNQKESEAKYTWQHRCTIKNFQTGKEAFMYIGRFEAKEDASLLNLSHFDSFVCCQL